MAITTGEGFLGHCFPAPYRGPEYGSDSSGSTVKLETAIRKE